MKFISKYSNFRITLKPSIQGNALLGNPPKPGLWVLFQDGFANVDDDEMAEMVKQHPAYKRGEIIEATENTVDPYKETRKLNEPEHIVSQFEHGVAKVLNPKKGVHFTIEQRAEMKRLVEEGIKDGLKIIMESTKEKKSEEILEESNPELEINELK